MRKDGQELARELENFVNGASYDDLNEFVKGFMSMHNTLQQKTFGLLLKMIIAMANAPYVDARNEESKKRAQQIVTGLKHEIVKELENEDAHFWGNKKAYNWVFGKDYDISKLPFV